MREDDQHAFWFDAHSLFLGSTIPPASTSPGATLSDTIGSHNQQA
jgi:hypothetical protein